MLRRLKILLVDAVLLVALSALTLMMLRADIVFAASVTGMELPGARAFSVSEDRAGARSAGDVAPLTLNVGVRKETGLILPGDDVALFPRGSEYAVLEAEVVAISGDRRAGTARVTLAVPEGERAPDLRDSYEISLSGLGGEAVHHAFEAPTPSQIIVRRYQEQAWELRTPGR